jgi:hypothetical protein
VLHRHKEIADYDKDHNEFRWKQQERLERVAAMRKRQQIAEIADSNRKMKQIAAEAQVREQKVNQQR